MYPIEDYIGQQVRRVSFLVKKAYDGKYHYLLWQGVSWLDDHLA